MNPWIESLFKRIQYRGDKNVQFEDLSELMLQFAKHVPFENISIIQGEDLAIHADQLKRKIIDQKRGGVCYELNPIFYNLLKELGFDVQMISATISGNEKQDLIGTHIAISLIHNQEKYIIDVGFGSNLALKPIPFTGEWVKSVTGEYRVRKEKTKWGDYILEKARNGEVEISYFFDLKPIDESYLNHVKDLITNHPNSPFNKSLLLAKITEKGHQTLTENSYTVTQNGEKNKQSIDSTQFKQLSKDQFGIVLE
ncbi:arylamine N-acetyltransferase family protein [Thermoflavimicrobium daqui]|uniref:Arylamine N-acetyltransferase n=1 Tax=Thermoflavimicrobium daqui TaxID=2137476 RepID=A0A364K7F0_9BACL|nr:arylamine N-acetyltransferase [Thermoflavimicrobium daqui]RAL26152.1 arylamine N-acetyltransferase [Thermoflavimicrobium daqui]